MPTRRATEEQPGTALALPADVRADLLRAQGEMIETVQRFPQARVMPAGAGLFEFKDTNDTVRDFLGVVLFSHARNLLWDRPYGSAESTNPDGSVQPPACVSNDGRIGVPREGFAHLALQQRGATTPTLAQGTERIDCRTCPYNQSKRLIDPTNTKKGKAVTNQRSVYILVQDRQVPVELVLPPTSLTPYDEYLASLLNRAMPVQAVLTKFSQTVTRQGGLAWATVEFRDDRALTQAEFDRVIEVRGRFLGAMTPNAEVLVEPTAADREEAATAATGGDEIPF
jgi:hypothetical protein